jgi:guanylate kinase
MTLVFIISAPSGSGKSTLVAAVRRLVDRLDFSVSYTTRPPRGSEEEGRDYYYTSRKVFESMIEKGEFLEYADVFGDYYGTARKFLDDARVRGHDLLLDIDVQGASQLQKNIPDAISIFILPPNMQELENRLRRRSSAERMTDEAKLKRRLETARREIEKYENYGYILVNDQLGDSIDALKAIILTERLRAAGRRPERADEERLMELAESRRLERVRPQLGPILESFRKSPASPELA